MDVVREKNMILSPAWLVTAIVTFIFGFTVLGYLAYRTGTAGTGDVVNILTFD